MGEIPELWKREMVFSFTAEKSCEGAGDHHQIQRQIHHQLPRSRAGNTGKKAKKALSSRQAAARGRLAFLGGSPTASPIRLIRRPIDSEVEDMELPAGASSTTTVTPASAAASAATDGFCLLM
jgi:hypothetical protein